MNSIKIYNIDDIQNIISDYVLQLKITDINCEIKKKKIKETLAFENLNNDFICNNCDNETISTIRCWNCNRQICWNCIYYGWWYSNSEHGSKIPNEKNINIYFHPSSKFKWDTEVEYYECRHCDDGSEWYYTTNRIKYKNRIKSETSFH